MRYTDLLLLELSLYKIMKKILFLYSTGNDRAINYLYDGFVKLFGRKNIIEFPELLAYVNETCDSIAGHKHAGRCFNYRDEFFNENDGGKRGWTKETIMEMAKNGEFEAVFCGCGIKLLKDDEFLKSKEKISIINNIEKVGYIDWSEHGHSVNIFSSEMDCIGREYFYFKREHTSSSPDKVGNGLIYPLPFSVIEQQNTNIRNDYSKYKKYDLFFSGGETIKDRVGISEKLPLLLNKDGKYRLNVSNKNVIHPDHPPPLSRKCFLEAISDSFLGLSFRGMGMDTFRFWEILSTGTCLFSQKLQLSIPNDYIDLEEAVYFSSFDELRDKFYYLMENKSKISEIAKKGYEKTLKFHTTDRRAEYVGDIMKLECFYEKNKK